VVKDEHAGIGHFGGGGDLVHLAASNQGRRIGTVAALQNLSYDDGAGTFGELTELGQRLFGIERDGVILGFQTDGFGG
jgi:hypothetical protein